MLEKIGLPEKPSLRGNNWVVDASHCQGCVSQFTFINRKHHCRRCGGIFCNRCTQQRMILRGQGDSPVRICEPCKKLEEAARFELRHGHKRKAGTSKLSSIDEDDILNQLLANAGNEPAASKRDAQTGASSGSRTQEVTPLDEEGARSVDEPRGEVGSTTPEDLRQQSVDEKNKYKLLKAEGKSAEAMKAFKRAKELERQAAALELQLRRNRRKALVPSSIAEKQINEDHPQESGRKNKFSAEKGKAKDDLAAELKALGWSDMDLDDAERKPAPTSVESELLNLMGQSSEKPNQNRAARGIDKTEVIELKKKALSLKREGRLAEAKEELKKAKLLERQLEEQEFLADAEDSDDEISALIRSLDSGKQDDMSTVFDLGSDFNFDNLALFSEDLTDDVKLDVTDDDGHDPEIAAALVSIGWTDESNKSYSSVARSSSLANEVLNLKKEAVNQGQSVNGAEIVPKELNGKDGKDTKGVDNVDRKQRPKSRLAIQRELLALKKRARALRMEGKVNEAEEELKKGKSLEQQLEEMDNDVQESAIPKVSEVVVPSVPPDISNVMASSDEGDDGVTDQDMHDPAYLKLLMGLGWQDEDLEQTNPTAEMPKQYNVSSTGITDPHPVKERKSKAEIQRELLNLKRKARALRSQGQADEAEELLEKAKVLESEMAILEQPASKVMAGNSEQLVLPQNKATMLDINKPLENETSETLVKILKHNRGEETKQVVRPTIPEVNPRHQEILGLKRKALVLKREGKLAEAREELRKAKLMEISSEEDIPKATGVTTAIDVLTSSVSSSSREEHGTPDVAVKPISSQERLKLQRECLTHKRNALKLRREGRMEESEAEQQLANALEAQLEKAAGPVHKDSSSDEVVVEDLFDPQLLSALKTVGIQDAHGASHLPTAPASTPGGASTHESMKSQCSSEERIQLEKLIKAEKRKALSLKQAGNKAEAINALRRAKQLEEKLNSLSS